MGTKNVLHIIETLGSGGAELLFVNYINALPSTYKNTVVFLRLPDTIKSKLTNYESIHVLNYLSKKDAALTIIKLSKLIKSHNIDLIHSHLYWPTIFSRLANRTNKPLIFSVHNLISEDAFNLNILSKYLEKLTYTSKQKAIFVSQATYDDYARNIVVSGYQKVIYNFVRREFFDSSFRKKVFSSTILNLVSVGNLRAQKNYLFLISSIGKLQHLPIKLDIYGDGPEKEELQRYILTNKVSNVRLMDKVEAPERILKNYDVFVSSSKYEGFYIAMVEAMAVGLPCIVPDLAVLKEVSGGEQLYYRSSDEGDFLNMILMLLNEPKLLKTFSERAVVVAAKYTIEEHIKQINHFYRKVTEK